MGLRAGFYNGSKVNKMSIDVAIELIKLALGKTTIFDLSEEARASAKPTNYKNKEVNLYDRTTFYFPYDEALNVIIDTQGRADSVKEFAEWLEDNSYLNWVGEGNDVNSMSAEEALSEWQKEAENE